MYATFFPRVAYTSKQEVKFVLQIVAEPSQSSSVIINMMISLSYYHHINFQHFDQYQLDYDHCKKNTVTTINIGITKNITVYHQHHDQHITSVTVNINIIY
jgi:hypothetical protein